MFYVNRESSGSSSSSSFQNDSLSRYLADLRSTSHELQLEAARALRQHVESESRSMSSEAFTKFFNNLNKRLFELVNSSDTHDIMGGIMVMDELIDVVYEENETKIMRFANYLRLVLQHSGDSSIASTALVKGASRALGHLARAGGTLAADIVEFEVKRCLGWLEGDRSEQRRYAAVLVLKELAQNTPALFNGYVQTFLDHIWVTLKDTKLQIRQAAIEALRSCLELIAKRGSRQRSGRYHKIFTEVQLCFKSNSADSTHGALLVIGELLSNSGEFMLARFKEVCDTVLKYKDHKDRLVRETVVTLLPKLAAFEPEAFVRGYLTICLQHTIGLLKHSKNGQGHGIAFTALGEMALAVRDNITPWLPKILVHVQLALDPKGRRAHSEEVLACVSMLARAVGPNLMPHVRDLVDKMFTSGLSPTLVDALTELAVHIPGLLSSIQHRLFTAIGAILHDDVAGSSASGGRAQTQTKTRKMSHARPSHTRRGTDADAGSQGLVSLALRTLGHFDFSGHNLLQFVHTSVVAYLDCADTGIRLQAAVTCTSLIMRYLHSQQLRRQLQQPANVSTGRSTGGGKVGGKAAALLGESMLPLPGPMPSPRRHGSGGESSGPASLVASLRPSPAGGSPALGGVLAASLAGSTPDTLGSSLGIDYGSSRLSPPAISGGSTGHKRASSRSRSGSRQPTTSSRKMSHQDFALQQAAAARAAEQDVAEGLLMGPTYEASMASLICDILERLLAVGVADSDTEIRLTVLQGLAPPCDQFLAQVDSMHLLFVALNDEVFAIRETSIVIIGRLAVRNPAYVMPSLRKVLVQLLTELQYGGDAQNRHESSKLLGHLIRSSGTLVQPYVQPILQVLLPRLQDSDSGVASGVMATLGTLAVIGGDEMTPNLERLLPVVIDTLQDKSSPVKREVALRTLGQLVESTGFVIQPYLQYHQLLPTVLQALKSGQASVRQEVVKVMGILGALDPFRHKMNQQQQQRRRRGGNKAASEAGKDGKGVNGAKNKHKKEDKLQGPRTSAEPANAALALGAKRNSEQYYPTVAITALMRILREPGHSQHHNKVIQAVMFICKSLGAKCGPFLPRIVHPFLLVMRTCEDGLRESLFTQLAVLVALVGNAIGPFVDDILALVERIWAEEGSKDRGMTDELVSVVEKISLALGADFKVYLPRLLPHMLQVLNSDRSPARRPAIKALHALATFGSNLDDYLHLILPSLVRLFEQIDAPEQVRKTALGSIAQLCYHLDFADYASRIIHPCVRLLGPTGKGQLREDIMQTLCVLGWRLGPAYAIYVPAIFKACKHDLHDRIVAGILRGEPLERAYLEPLGILRAAEWGRAGALGGSSSSSSSSGSSGSSNSGAAALESKEPTLDQDLAEATKGGAGVKKLRVSQLHLKKVWEATQRSSKEDWEEWIRAFSIELLKQSPSPALRACSILAQKYHVLAQELFNAAFVSCWTELYDHCQDDLVRNLETAFKSPGMPPDLLQILLNLAEFMEHDGKRLPIAERTLGALAEQCHAYAKALHYKELEFHTSPSATYEALISINNQLQQPEAAVGILKYAQLHHSLELKASWYEKLQRWEEALEAYERKQLEVPRDDAVTLGRMRCLRALGEWERLALLSGDLWKSGQLDSPLRVEIAPLAASAAWNLGRWDNMDEYLAVMPEGGLDSEFFRAILSTHRARYPQALHHIARARELLESELTALVGESYSRAYRVVVQVQQMTELEEVIQYKTCDSAARRAHIRSMWSKRLKGCQRDVDVWQQVLAVRSLVVSPQEDVPQFIKFSSLCRKSGRHAMSLKVLTNLLGWDSHRYRDPPPPVERDGYLYSRRSRRRGGGVAAGSAAGGGRDSSRDSSGVYGGLSGLDFGRRSRRHTVDRGGDSTESVVRCDMPQVSFAYMKHLWAAGFREEARRELQGLLAGLGSAEQRYLDSEAGRARLEEAGGVVPPGVGDDLRAVGSGGAGAAAAGAAGAGAVADPGGDGPLNSGSWVGKSGELPPPHMPPLPQHTSRKNSTTGSVGTMHGGGGGNGGGDTWRVRVDYLNGDVPERRRREEVAPRPVLQLPETIIGGLTHESYMRLKGKCWLKLGQWTLAVHDTAPDVLPTLMQAFGAATQCDPRSYKVWHGYAVLNFRIIAHYKALIQQRKDARQRAEEEGEEPEPLAPGEPTEAELEAKITPHLVPAIQGFFRSIALAGDQSLQDILRLLTLWFAHGSNPTIAAALQEGFDTLPIDTWLPVIPQIIARIDTNQISVRRAIAALLCKIGKAHPQALVYPLTVASKSHSAARKGAAIAIMNSMRLHSGTLVEQALMVSRELIRVAILWHEIWHEALEEASRLWFGGKNVDGMLAALEPLHQMMAEGPATLREVGFLQQFGRDLEEGRAWCDKYKRTGNDSDLNAAWDLYCTVFRRINKQLSRATRLELRYVSPILLGARDLELAVPGTIQAQSQAGGMAANAAPVRIAHFAPALRVIESKQRPRKLEIVGSDGLEYSFLLKGHEDLRQDKRVMQLFGLVNTLLANDNDTSKTDLSIRGYSVIPLAPNSGLIQWLPHCDTLHALIKDYRDAHKVLLNIEHRLMLQMAPDYQQLTLMQKVEVFEHALSRTTGTDLAKVLWLKSENSEVWLDRRTNYTRSLAVMCMVGYVLGLGDRHPCNLMLDRNSGKIIHIDFGDCFEVAIHRDKFPEKIPFRLTRILINAMEVSGIEGNFRSTCENVMRVLRDNKESVMAVLEAFVYDPLINWRLLKKGGGSGAKLSNQSQGAEAGGSPEMVASSLLTHTEQLEEEEEKEGQDGPGKRAPNSLPNSASQMDVRPAGLNPADEDELVGQNSEKLNARAVSVIARVEDKLTGKDFGEEKLDVPNQVEKLIRQATSHTNLCQCYIGWCPFW